MMCVKISTAPPQAERDVRPSGANPGESGIFFFGIIVLSLKILYAMFEHPDMFVFFKKTSYGT